MYSRMYKRPRAIVCAVDESGSLALSVEQPFRVGFLLTCRPHWIEADLQRLKREVPPRSKYGIYHAREDNPYTRSMVRRVLSLNGEPRMCIIEWDKKKFSAKYFKKDKLAVFSDSNMVFGSFALMATEIAACASANGFVDIVIICEASSNDIKSEHKARSQSFSSVLGIALEKQMAVKSAPNGSLSQIAVLTRRKRGYPILSCVDYWLWAYCRSVDHGDEEVFPVELSRRTTIRRMTPESIEEIAE